MLLMTQILTLNQEQIFLMVAKTNLRDSYKQYKERAENPVDVRIYLYIVTGFIKFIMRKVFEGFDIELSAGRSLGTIGVRGKKQKLILDSEGNIIGGAGVDYKATNELRASNEEARLNNTRVFHLNEHTNGITYHLRWWQEGMKVTYKRMYCLTYCKDNRRKMASMIFSGKEYLVK